jgi:hypothetical protein
MKRFTVTLTGLLAAALFAVCGSTPAQAQADLARVTSYYVRANGSDSNAGTSENAPFKTLARAIQAASGTSVKVITVIGTLDGQTEITNSGTGEILITGKANASANEKAVLTTSAEGTNTIAITGNSNIKLEHLTVTVTTIEALSPIYIEGGNAKLTLGRNTVVTNNLGIDAEVYPLYGGGALVVGGTLVMLDNAMITNSVANAGGGVAVVDGATLIMQDNAVISNNIAKSDHFDYGGGGGIYSLDGRIVLRDNASVTGNSAPHSGGIILRFSEIETADNLQIGGSGLYESRQVSGNTATGTWMGMTGGDNIRVHNK